MPLPHLHVSGNDKQQVFIHFKSFALQVPETYETDRS